MSRHDQTVKADKHVHIPTDSPLFGWYIVFIILLVLLGGLFSGLTLGLMGLDAINLQVLSVAGTPAERRQAPRVLRLIQRGRHTMLVVLLLGNTLVNTSLPIFLDSIVGGGWIAVLGSTALELVFGEILPQSICDKHGLAIGAAFTPFVAGLTLLTYPVAKPIGWVLDRTLGSHATATTYRKAELKTLLSVAVEDKLQEDEVGLLGSMLEFAGKTVVDAMTRNEDVYSLSAERIVDDELVQEILRKGYSRIPVYEPSSPETYVGCMTLRSLVSYDPSDLKPASALVSQALPQCAPDLPLFEAMSYFQTGRSHMMLVTSRPGEDSGALGVVTLEDVVEELIGKEIIDETDQYVNIRTRIPVVRGRPRAEPSGLKRIYEGRLARRRAAEMLDDGEGARRERLIDHPETA